MTVLSKKDADTHSSKQCRLGSSSDEDDQ